MSKAHGYAAQNATTPLAPFDFERRAVEPRDVSMDILYCGICHSDTHQARDEWGGSLYPMVPGHEIIGRVREVGAEVSRFAAGDLVGVGCMVDSCRTCASCREGLEQYCENGMVATYNARDKQGELTFGGYSDHIVVDQDFVLRVPDNLDAAAAAPLLCAGITTYSPLRHWGVGKGQRVGIVGLGGLGHMGVKFAAAMGAEVVMITTSPEKGADARKLGAHDVLLSKDAAAMKAQAGTFDFILNTIPVAHDVNPYMALLKRDGTMVVVGALADLPEVSGVSLILGRKRLAGSVIGGIAETQEMLDFCGVHNIVCDIEVIEPAAINESYERMIRGDVKYRFVIDMARLRG